MIKKIKNLLYSNKGLFLIFFLFLISILFATREADIEITEDNNIVIDEQVNDVDKKNIISQVTEDESLIGSLPVILSVPKINLNTSFEKPLDLDEEGAIKVPDSYKKVGWYKHSPKPGEIGPSVILGHVDSSTGPAVFYSLGQLEVDDDIYIEKDDGSTTHFIVTSLERYAQNEFPTNKVYGNIDHAGLRLITCSGIFIRGKQRYTHNLVVYAKLVI